MRHLVVVPILLAAISAGLHAADAVPPAQPVAQHRIVIQVNIDGEDKWNEVLTNVENVQRAFGADHVRITIVSHGAGAGLVLAKNTALKERIEKIIKTGPAFELCNNTVLKKGIKPEDITPGVIVVDSGIAEVVRLQEQGWTYIKGGS